MRRYLAGKAIYRYLVMEETALNASHGRKSDRGADISVFGLPSVVLVWGEPHRFAYFL